ncbi:glycolipid transfer protein B [Toxorhynchites rutilus septentrionalis]|uniref:glycolipid transfer protein B n=1 Tax=Toxorhynchites rutilus septentrionalis TaxID=329112 RepID=UPI002478B9DF|nr:glycolipid transfer protein B [Toxorhynchites rutilus septentrionalis]
MASRPSIDFSKLQCFPEIESSNKKIITKSFLESASQVIDSIETFGMIFKPIVKDMRGNVKRLEGKYRINEQAFYYLEDMILYDEDGNRNSFDSFTEGLLWLKRALEMIEMFFRNVLDDTSCSDSLKQHLRKAYDNTLLPYHGFLAQKGFQILHHYVPSRTALLGSKEPFLDNVNALKVFLISFKANIDHLNTFFESNNFNRTYKV